MSFWTAFENGQPMPAVADNFFRYHDGEKTEVESDGDVSSPVGYFTLRFVNGDDISDYAIEQGDPWASARLDPGWYIDVRDSDGNVWAFYYGEQATLNEEKARADFATGAKEYEKWHEIVEPDHHDHEHKFGEMDECVTCGLPKSELPDEPEGGVIKFAPGTVVLDMDDPEEPFKRVDAMDAFSEKHNLPSDSEKLYLMCNRCGEVFDKIKTASEHGQSVTGTDWCGEDGFVIVPESEAF